MILLRILSTRTLQENFAKDTKPSIRFFEKDIMSCKNKADTECCKTEAPILHLVNFHWNLLLVHFWILKLIIKIHCVIKCKLPYWDAYTENGRDFNTRILNMVLQVLVTWPQKLITNVDILQAANFIISNKILGSKLDDFLRKLVYVSVVHNFST